MLNTDEMSKLYQLNRDIDNATYELKRQRQDERDRLRRVIIEKTVKKVLKAIGRDHFEAVITFAIRDAIQESQNVSEI